MLFAVLEHIISKDFLPDSHHCVPWGKFNEIIRLDMLFLLKADKKLDFTLPISLFSPLKFKELLNTKMLDMPDLIYNE
jgi:hypothetical protein